MTVQCKLKKDQVVTILGEQDEYYRIRPPAEAYLYIHQRYCEPVKQLAGPATRGTSVAENTGVRIGEPVAPATQPSENAIAMSPATQPAVEPTREEQQANVEAEFEKLETQFRGLAGKLEDQPLPDLLAAYDKLAKNDHLPFSMKTTVDMRVTTLRVKNDARNELLATMRDREKSAEQLRLLADRRKEAEDKMANGIEVFTAIGQFNASTIQNDGATLYRLTDPATNRTLCYVRSNEPSFVKFIGELVGVKGELATDQQLTLRVVNATQIKQVEAGRVHDTATAQILPPSMMVLKKTASTDN